MIEKLFTIGIKDKEQPFHWYNTLELFFVIRGAVDLTSDDSTVRMSEGMIQVVNTEDIHALENKTEDLLYIQLSLNMEAFNQYIPNIDIVYFKCDSEGDDIAEEIKNYIAQMVRMLSKYSPNEYIKSETEQTLIYYCVEILNDLKMSFNYGRYETENATEKELEKIEQVREVVDYLFDNGMNKITLKDAADHIYVGTSTFKKLMKEYGGVSFEKLLSSIRAEMSLKYLLDSNMSITNIAYECGFSAPRYYYSAFEKKYNCSPAEYRERNRKHFTKEKKVDTVSLAYDENATLKDALEILETYDEFKTDSEKSRNIINIDLAAKRIYNEKFPEEKKPLVFEDEDVYRPDLKEELLLCSKKLGLEDLCIIVSNDNVFTNIKKNYMSLGFRISKAEQGDNFANKSIRLTDLFGKYGEKKPLYYIYELFNDIDVPFIRLNQNCILYECNGNLNITVLNIDEDGENLLYKFDISGLEDNADYLCVRKSIPRLSKHVQELLESEVKEIDREIVKDIVKQDIQYDAYKTGMPFIIDVAVGSNSFVNIEIIKLL